MELKDIYDLRLGQEIWHKGDKHIINLLHFPYNGNVLISFKDYTKDALDWNEVHQDCSLTPPKKKVKKTFYQGIYTKDDGSISYYDGRIYSSSDWENTKTSLLARGFKESQIISREFEVEE